MRYEVKIKGHLNNLATCFEGFSIVPNENGVTLLMGPIVDQAALYGLLKKMYDLGISLISVVPLETDE